MCWFESTYVQCPHITCHILLSQIVLVCIRMSFRNWFTIEEHFMFNLRTLPMGASGEDNDRPG